MNSNSKSVYPSSFQLQSGQCFAPDVCCKTQSLDTSSTVLTNEGYVVRVPTNQYLPPEGQNTNTHIQTAQPPPPPPLPQYVAPTTSRPPPTTTRYVPPPTTTRYVPPPTTTRYVPPPTTTRYVPPPTTTRYFPPPTTTRQPPYQGVEYIPPREEIPAPSNTDPNAVRPPQQNESASPADDTPAVVPPPRPNQPPRPPTNNGPPAPPPLPPVGCSAAMNCTEAQYCSSTGVISKTPVNLTPEQELFRVPVTECRSPDKGFTGVCCRDPDYVDPWPVGMLGLYNPELLPFDDGSYKPNGNNGATNGNSIQRTNEAIQASPSRVTTAQTFGPNQITAASQTQYTQTAKSQYDRGVTAAASTTSAVQQQSTSNGGSKRFTAGGLQFVHSGNTKFKPFQKESNGQCAPRNYVSIGQMKRMF